jgi:hypothetical protein
MMLQLKHGPFRRPTQALERAGGGTRTHGLSFTRALLCQLSYSGELSAYKTRADVVLYGNYT